MARHKGDHEARRREVSAAVWRVLATHGFSGLTLRGVASEMGVTTGLLTHYFAGKKDLVAHALTLLDEHRAAKPRSAAPEGLPGLRAQLMDILPLTPQIAADNRVWVSSWDAALSEPDLAAGHAARYAQSRQRIAHHIQAAQRLGQLPPSDPDDVAASIQSFILGLIVQALFDPTGFPPHRQIRLLDDHLATLATDIGPDRATSAP